MTSSGRAGEAIGVKATKAGCYQSVEHVAQSGGCCFWSRSLDLCRVQPRKKMSLTYH